MPREEGLIRRVTFGNLNLDDPFFDSLKNAYAEFSDWFNRKAEEKAFVVFDNANNLQPNLSDFPA